MTNPPTLADLMTDPGELDVLCLDCHHNATMPMTTLLPRYAAETPFPEVWGRFRCSACGSRYVDVRPNWAARQAAGQITPPLDRSLAETRTPACCPLNTM